MRVRAALSRRPALVAALALALAWLVSLELWPWSNESVGDLGTRASFAEQMLAGELPYRDFDFEYPPLAAAPIAVAGLAGAEVDAFRLGIAAVCFVAALTLMLIAREVARHTGGSEALAMLAVVAAPLLIGAVIRLHVDVVAASLALGGLLAVIRGWPAGGLALIALGAMTKGFPIVAAPATLAWTWARFGAQSAWRAAGAFAATVVAFIAVAIALSPQGAVDALAYQLDRPLQVESPGASLLLVADLAGAGGVTTFDSHGSVALDHPLADAIGLACAVTLALTIALLAVLAGWAAREAPADRVGAADPESAAERALVLAGAAALVAAVALGPVLSPQFVVFAVPLLAVALAWSMHAVAAATAMACVLTLVEFPTRYFDLVEGEPLAILIVAARNVVLIAAVALAIRSLALDALRRTRE